MCLAKAYLKESDGEKILLDNVVFVESTDEKVIVTTILKEKKEVSATISSVDFANSTIVLET